MYMASQGAATPELVARMAVDNVASSSADPVGRVDFARRSGGQLLVYGWILGLASGISRATLDYGNLSVDLCGQAIRVPRPDVTRHHSSTVSADDNYHGFYVLVDLPDPQMPEAQLRLFITSRAGRSSESHWSVSPDMSQGMLDVLKGLIRQVPQSEADRLAAFAGLSPQQEADSVDTPTHFEVQLCCILGQRLVIVAGMLSNVRREISAIELTLGRARLDVLGSSVPVSFLRRSSAEQPSGSAGGFFFAAELDESPQELQAIFAIRTVSQEAQLTRSVTSAAAEVRAQLLSFVGTLDPEGVILLTGRVRSLLEALQVEQSVAAFLGVLYEQTMEQLPSAFQNTNPRIELHVDSGVRVGDKGMFVRGWLYAEPSAAVKVSCNCGSVTVDVSDRWIRYPRPDVTTYLANHAIATANDEHGFFRFLDLPLAEGQCHLAVTTTKARVVRLARINMAERVSFLQAIHFVLRGFNNIQGKQLSALLDDRVGPAVAAIWSRRAEGSHEPVNRQFGSPPPNPTVSVIVVLQGNWELSVKEQLASFAYDPDFQREELIYVVEGLASDVQLWHPCEELYEQYRVPFTMLCIGGEIGFAGASNCAARLARGAKLLWLGSDVRPKRAEWLGEMTRVYEKLEVPGVLGVKLLHENGSVRDAGGEFLRRSEWGDLWDRYSPQEGQNAAHLTGLREVAAVTAASMMIDAGLYRDLGGLCEDYIQCDFADSDLCMQATLAGRRNRVALDIELFQPQRPPRNINGDTLFDTRLRLYNCWLHQRRWAQLIASRVQRTTTPSASSVQPAPAG